MSHSSSRTTLADYRAALSVPESRRPAVASLLARLPIAMIGIAALLYVRQVSGSFAIGGLVSASAISGVAAGSVVQGRLIDRFGPTRPLLVASVLFTVTTAALVVAIETGLPTPVLVVLAATIGMTQPNTSSASRALWGRLLPPGPLRTAAFSYEAISLEVFFILGPGLAGLLVTAPWPGTGLVFSAACLVTGSVLFALSPAVRSWPPAASGKRTLLGAFTSPGMRTLALAVLGFGIVIGYVEVAVPAAATAAGSMVLGGLLLSLWSVSSVAFGVLYSLRPWPRSIGLRLPFLLAGFGGLVGLLAVPSTLWGLAIAMLAAGVFITPQSTVHSLAIEVVAPEGTEAEAFGWVITAATLGVAIGHSTSGYVVEHAGSPTAFLTAMVAGLVFAALVWLLRGTVRPPNETRLSEAVGV